MSDHHTISTPQHVPAHPKDQTENQVEEQHAHQHTHEHAIAPHHSGTKKTAPVLTIRATSGLSGDMTLAGLALMSQTNDEEMDELIQALLLPVSVQVRVEPRDVNEVRGWSARVDVPHEHAHRSFADIKLILEKSALQPEARELAVAAFARLAEAEARVHGKKAHDICFHEVGAMDSIVDIALCSALYVKLGSPRLVCSPLPLGEGGVQCAHGWLPTPAPAVLEMLEGVPVYGFPGQGETITPTALTLLKTLKAQFGPWPAMTVERRALVYGGKVFAHAPNGTIWAYGASL